MTQKPVSDYVHHPRRDLPLDQHVDDPYLSREKLTEPTVCPDCGAIFHKGHWQWGKAADGAVEHRCPACSRIHDKVPAGVLTLQGEFFNAHKSEIMHLIHNKESQEKAEHALERIMSIEEQQEPQQTVVNYTGVHLTRSTSQEIEKSYHGKLEVEFTDKDAVMHARWER